MEETNMTTLQEKQQEGVNKFLNKLAFRLKVSKGTMEAIRLFREELPAFLKSEVELVVKQERELYVKAHTELIKRYESAAKLALANREKEIIEKAWLYVVKATTEECWDKDELIELVTNENK